MSFLSHVENLFKKIVAGVRNLFDDPDKALRGAEKVARIVTDLMAFVLPWAKAITDRTAATTDDRLVSAAATFNLTIQDVLDEPDPMIRKGRILSIVGRAARIELMNKADELAGQKIKLGSINIRVPGDVAKISGDLFDLAAQAAYTLLLKDRSQTPA